MIDLFHFLGQVFMQLFNVSMTAGWFVLAVVLIRLLLKKAPKWISCVLWGMVAIRLICPFSLAGVFTKERVVQTVNRDSVFEGFRFLFRNKPLMLIVLGNVLGTLSSVASVFGNYYYNEVLNFMSLSLIVGLFGTIGGYAAYIALPKIKKRFATVR